MSDAAAFEPIRQALTSLELFRNVYASSTPSAEQAAKLVDLLRSYVAGNSESKPHLAALYEHVARGIEVYTGLKQLDYDLVKEGVAARQASL